MAIYIHKDLLGFQQHLVCTEPGKLPQKTNQIPEGDDNSIVYGDSSSIEISKLYGIEYPEFPSLRYRKAYQTVLGPGTPLTEIPWALALSIDVFKEELTKLSDYLLQNFSGLDLSYYRDHYKKTNEIFQYFQTAKIDPITWKFHELDQKLITPHVFRSFTPNEDGFAEKVIYDRCGTKTGRLLVSQGPQILHLPRIQRNIIASRFPKGKILYLDFSALEPWILFFLIPPSPLPGYVPLAPLNTSSQVVTKDLYQSLLDRLSLKEVGRDQFKEVVLSQIYGAGYETIIAKLRGLADPTGFLSLVDDLFGLPALREALLSQYEAHNRQYILNVFGRRIDTSDASPYQLLNYYTQSAGVEVALYGFLSFLRQFKDNPGVVPLFLIHDGLVLDVSPTEFTLVSQFAENGISGIPKFPNRVFPVKLTFFRDG